MAEHAMPKGIRRVEKGVYRTLDDRHEIRQDGKVWRLVELLGDSQVGLGEFASRGGAVAKPAEDGKLPAEAPKVEQPKEQPAKAQEPKEQPKRRPRTRKPAKAVAASAQIGMAVRATAPLTVRAQRGPLPDNA